VRIEGQGKYLIPGLADMHMHLIRGLFRPDGKISRVTERDLVAELGQGVTTIRNISRLQSTESGILRLRDLVASGRVLGPRIYTSGAWWGKGERAGLGAVQPAEVAALVAAYKTAGYDFIKPYDEAPEVFDSLAAAARRVGLTFQGHVPRKITIEQVIRAPYKSVEHYLPAVDGGGVDYMSAPEPARIQAVAEILRRGGTWYCPTLYVTGGDNWERQQLMKLLQGAGIRLLLGVDADGAGLGVHKELQAMVRMGLTPYQALATATTNVAAFYDKLKDEGTVAVGKRADLVLLDGNPLQDIKNTMKPAGVVIGGHWLPREEIDRRVTAIKAFPVDSLEK
jgi:imidazolonepropionase-like amidohydrolase